MTVAHATESADIIDRSDTAGPSVIDRGAILEHFENDVDFVREIAELFIAACPRRLSAIHEAVLGCDTKALQMAAHSLRGSASNFGALAVVTAALDLEKMGREGDLRHARQACEKLEQEIARLKGALAALLQCTLERSPQRLSDPEEVYEALCKKKESN
ncbi:MAG: Hpt domain-containing protein [Candidatus Binatia bacterium]